MNKFSKYSTIAMVAMLFLGMFYVLTPSVFAATNIEIVNPIDGTHNFSFTTSDKAVGDTFLVNLTVVDVANLASWQTRVTWDPALLEYVNVSIFPSDHVFTGLGPILVPPDFSVPGSVLAGAAALSGTFTGTGTLAVLTLKIIQGVSGGGPTSVTCDITFAGIGTDTFLLDGGGLDIPFTPVNGVYEYMWVVPVNNIDFKLAPTPIKPTKIGDGFSVNVQVSNVNPNWEIIAFQFSIMWNTTLIAPAGPPFFANGSFFETFQYQPDGVVYASDINAHYRGPTGTPLAPDYNFSTVGVLLMPDLLGGFVYHAPFPSGGGLLATLYFTAIYDTIAPDQIISSIDFIAEDFLVLTTAGAEIGYRSATGAVYYAPQVTLGLSIDLYTQYPAPFGGQGPNQYSDSFGPQQEVDLFALVTYNAYPVQQKLVGYQIYHQGATQGYNFVREGTTDADGVAHVSFRLPWPCNDPVNEIFGWWYVNATVEVAEQVVVDNLRFWVWWPVGVVTIEPKFTAVNQTKQGCTMEFEMVYRTYHLQDQNVLLTATIYDELSFFIGSAFKWDIVPGSNPPVYPADLLPGDPIPADFVWDFTVAIPSNAVVGKCTVFGNAFSSWPWLGGYPYCPEVTNTLDFRITKP